MATKNTKWLKNVPNGRTKYIHFVYSTAFQNIPKYIFWVWTYTIWQPWYRAVLISQGSKCHWLQRSIARSIADVSWQNNRFLRLETTNDALLHIQHFKRFTTRWYLTLSWNASHKCLKIMLNYPSYYVRNFIFIWIQNYPTAIIHNT
jgi:hypothetical protein